MKDGQCHVRGVFIYSDGDKYAGEYRDNNMHGLGEYQWDNGTTYWGQWKDNQMHGCGLKVGWARSGKSCALVFAPV